MAKSRYEYVKSYEQHDELARNAWVVIRIDGRGFHRFSKVHDFAKPNDERALRLMNMVRVCKACSGVAGWQSCRGCPPPID